mmetsp:Transcript_6533/g.14507  ORF Transcript_6533/g.14507 Transcript_6533/m.14507 type:complete len:175 (-) Transcript_6533:67-591(-)
MQVFRRKGHMLESNEHVPTALDTNAQSEDLHTMAPEVAQNEGESKVECYVLGPVWVASSSNSTNFEAVLVCPVCDEHSYPDNKEVQELFTEMRASGMTTRCSTEWLRGRKLSGVGFKRLRDDAECLCFESIPCGYEGRPNNEVRFFHHQTCAVMLGTKGEKRAKLPGSVGYRQQ